MTFRPFSFREIEMFASEFKGSRAIELACFVAAGMVACLSGNAAHAQVEGKLEAEFRDQSGEIIEFARSGLLLGLVQLWGGARLEGELTGEQEEELKKLTKKMVEKLQNTKGFSKGFFDHSDFASYRSHFGAVIKPEDVELQREQVRTLKDWSHQLREILLPHQYRLLEIGGMQRHAIDQNKQKRMAFGTFGVPLGLAKELELDSNQQDSLEKITSQKITEYREKELQYNREAMREILAALPEEKRKRLEELVGDLTDSAAFPKR